MVLYFSGRHSGSGAREIGLSFVSCVEPAEPPGAALRAAEAFERAVLLGKCEVAWGLLSESRRLLSDRSDFCKRLAHSCSSGVVKVQSSEMKGPHVEVAGGRQCDGARGITFWLELSPQGGGWAVSSFTEGE